MQHGRTADAGAARTRRAASAGSLLVAAAACVAAVGVVVPATPAPAAETIPAPPVVGEFATHIALEQLGKPYAWGGAGPDAFDCSGLTAYSWDTAAGADLSLVAATQASSDVVPTAGSSLEPGDLVFYDDPGVAGIAHVSLFVANDAGSLVKSADNPALPVRLQPMGWWTSPPVAMGRSRSGCSRWAGGRRHRWREGRLPHPRERRPGGELLLNESGRHRADWPAPCGAGPAEGRSARPPRLTGAQLALGEPGVPVPLSAWYLFAGPDRSRNLVVSVL